MKAGNKGSTRKRDRIFMIVVFGGIAFASFALGLASLGFPALPSFRLEVLLFYDFVLHFLTALMVVVVVRHFSTGQTDSPGSGDEES